jgi:uncharacterized membrane protein
MVVPAFHAATYTGCSTLRPAASGHTTNHPVRHVTTARFGQIGGDAFAGRARRERELEMLRTLVVASLYDWLLLLHILAAMVWLGGLVTLSLLATLVLRSREDDSIGRFVASLRVIGPAALAPAMVAVLGFGIWMVIRSDAWDFGRTWVVLALALFAASFVVGAVFQSRTAIGAQRAVEAGDHGEAARQLRRWSWGMRLIHVLLVVVTWDMVIKPGL